ncbi:Ribonuclease H-like superfamily protein [Rhynchospora pubera]|uniref:Ribonuclease H-like superfamily protein n=1 Tax=Rhynchospora pubera TaxID=906938 RepID=A0AAV8G767_9POAL|nr:Ribonuclease H-like superfamily protein [Rhynchospora pubera]
MPKKNGGLGLRDFRFVNDAMVFKTIWKLTSRDYENDVWVQIIRAKYLARKSFWLARVGGPCTRLWRAMLALRPKINTLISWQIGRGNKCCAFGEPWHDFWLKIQPSNSAQRALTISDLVQQGGTTWDSQCLIDSFGFETALFISIKFPIPPLNSLHSDRLVLTASRTGKFSFKTAYHILAGSSTCPLIGCTDLLKLIWYSPGILPRIRLFVWKLLWDALPVQGTFLNRLGSPIPPCALCRQGPEDALHALFLCDHARAFWFASPLTLHFNNETNNVCALLSGLSTALSGRSFVCFANLMWAFWKQRCSFVYDSKKFQIQTALQLAAYYNNLSTASSCMSIPRKLRSQNHTSDTLEITDNTALTCFVDGSHDQLKRGGWAYIFSNRGTLVSYGVDSGTVASPFLAELKAMETGVRAVIHSGFDECLFLTDCLHLQQILVGKAPPDSVHWTEFQHTINLLQLFRAQVGFKCQHISRDGNTEAHFLANYARCNAIKVQDFTYPLFNFLGCC